MHGRHPQHRGNEKKANVGDTRAKDNSVSNSDSETGTLQHKKIDDHNIRWQEKQQQKSDSVFFISTRVLYNTHNLY